MANPNAVPPIYDKHPADDLDYGIDWEANGWLETGETVVTSTWTVPAGITMFSSGIDPSGKKTFLWLRGGTLKKSYSCLNNIITSSTPPRKVSRTIIIQVLSL